MEGNSNGKGATQGGNSRAAKRKQRQKQKRKHASTLQQQQQQLHTTVKKPATTSSSTDSGNGGGGGGAPGAEGEQQRGEKRIRRQQSPTATTAENSRKIPGPSSHLPPAVKEAAAAQDTLQGLSVGVEIGAAADNVGDGDDDDGARGGGATATATAEERLELEEMRKDGIDGHVIARSDELDSATKASTMLQWLIAPTPNRVFYTNHWERAPLVIQRSGGGDEEADSPSSYYDGWFSKAKMEVMLKEQALQYGVDVDVTRYEAGRRTTLNPVGDDLLVEDGFVWRNFRQGCSVRLLCPQKHDDDVWLLLSTLEEQFGSMVGCNVYLTPAGSQGFAPHYDDIDAFVLQIEGKKHWRVYAPPSEADALPMTSSGNFTQAETTAKYGEPVVDVVLSPGDLLYMPRGFVHQAVTVKDDPEAPHSLHVTVSANQNNSYTDLIETLLPQALAAATAHEAGLRRSLPRDFLGYMGVAHDTRDYSSRAREMIQEEERQTNVRSVDGSTVTGSSSGGHGGGGGGAAGGAGFEDPRRELFRKVLRSHLHRLVDSAVNEQLDGACDLMARRFISDRLPPVLTGRESARSYGDGGGDARRLGDAIGGETPVRLIRGGAARLVIEDGMAVVYHMMDNGRVHHGNPLQPLEFETDDAPLIEALLDAYPQYTRVTNLPHPPMEDLQDKVGVVEALFREGFIVIGEDTDMTAAASADDDGINNK